MTENELDQYRLAFYRQMTIVASQEFEALLIKLKEKDKTIEELRNNEKSRKCKKHIKDCNKCTNHF